MCVCVCNLDLSAYQGKRILELSEPEFQVSMGCMTSFMGACLWTQIFYFFKENDRTEEFITITVSSAFCSLQKSYTKSSPTSIWYNYKDINNSSLDYVPSVQSFWVDHPLRSSAELWTLDFHNIHTEATLIETMSLKKTLALTHMAWLVHGHIADGCKLNFVNTSALLL